MEFYSYRLMIRKNQSNHLFLYRRLLLQFVVDMYAKIESERLLFIRLNQKKLRCDEYIHLRDSLNSDGNVKDVGKMIILPSTYIGSPRHMHEYSQDALTYVRKYGRPDLFITFTCNPSWPEIKELLFDDQTHYDRHDIIARVFNQKVNKLMKFIIKYKIYGEIRCWMYSIEWQKRGLPHVHILIWCATKILPIQIDKIISAELPDPKQDPVLFEIVKKHMIHGPCGSINPKSPCMKDGFCTAKYPRSLISETQTGKDGYPQYRRRKPEEGGFQTMIRMSNKELYVDNRWIVPYSPILSKTFKAHINVEFCSSVKSIKYICKYVYKGT